MKKIIAKKTFTSNVGAYIKGEEIKGLTYNQIVKLNELGFIDPLGFEDLIVIKKELENPKIYKEEE